MSYRTSYKRFTRRRCNVISKAVNHDWLPSGVEPRKMWRQVF